MLVEAHQNLVYAVAIRFVRNAEDAEDITQDVFVRLWRNLGSYREEQGQLSTWLYKITTNCCLDFERSVDRRARRQWTELDRAQMLSVISGPDRELESRELHQAVQEAAGVLPAKQRLVFILRDMQGLNPDEVALALDMTKAQVKSNLFLAREKLSVMLRHFFEQTKNRG